MLLRKFRETGPDIIVLIFIILLVVWLRAFIHPQLPSALGFDASPMPLFRLLMELTGNLPLISVILGFLLVLLIAFLLVSLNTAVFFISERTFLPAAVYVLLSGFIPQVQVLNPALPATVFLILAIRKIMDSYKVQGTAFTFFDAGLLISIGSLFYVSFIWFGLLLVIGILILRPVNFKEIIISCIGLATPWFITIGFLYVAGGDVKSLLSGISYNLFGWDANSHINWIVITGLGITGLIFLLCTLYLLSAINMKRIKSRKTFVLLIWIFVISVVIYLIFKPVSLEVFWIGAVPVSYILTHYFVFKRERLLPEIYFTALFILVALIQVLTKY
ncbi:MAG: hypothetical protein Q8868_10625 [Bacteroidota bacterium]|nr:hypothetical protein [Bacteroidota bacterium]